MIIFIINVSVDDYLNIWSIRCQKIVKKRMSIISSHCLSLHIRVADSV